MRLAFNLLKLILHLGLAAVLGYYNYVYNQQGPYNGALALGTSICFLFIGSSMVLTWQRKERKVIEHVFEALSSQMAKGDLRSVDGPAESGVSE